MQRALAIIFLVPLVVLARFAPTAHATQNAQPPAPYRLEREGPVAELPCERNFTTDRFGRRITFYLYIPEAAKATPLPLVVYIHGSACCSVFARRPEDGAIRATGGHGAVPTVVGERAVTLVVEKPGVEFLDPYRQATPCPDSYNEEHTLERWSEAIEAAIRAAQQSPAVKRATTLVIGHSEGGLVACKVARGLPDLVTHVACVAGGGGSQLFDVLTLARKGIFFNGVSENPDERVQFVVDEWRKIRADPMSTEKQFFGFAYRRWSTFLASSPMRELEGVGARIYIAQGTADEAVDPASADLLYAHLLACGKDPTYDRVEGADHGFRIAGTPPVNGWADLYGRVVDWFLKP